MSPKTNKMNESIYKQDTLRDKFNLTQILFSPNS